MADLEDPPQRPLMQVRIGAVTLVLVVPVNHVHGSIRTVSEIEHLAPRVVGHQEVGRVRRGVAGSSALQTVGVRPEPVDVVHQDRVAVLPGPAVAAEVDHRPRVGMAAAGRAGPAVARVRAAVADPVHVIGHRLDVVVNVRIEVAAGLALVPRAGNDVIEVLDHTGGRERVAVVVERQAPRVARALSEDLERASWSGGSATRRHSSACVRRRSRPAGRRSSW